MGPEKEAAREILWDLDLRRALDRLPLDPPASEEEIETRPPSDFYCTTCDSGYCTCGNTRNNGGHHAH